MFTILRYLSCKYCTSSVCVCVCVCVYVCVCVCLCVCVMEAVVVGTNKTGLEARNPGLQTNLLKDFLISLSKTSLVTLQLENPSLQTNLFKDFLISLSKSSPGIIPAAKKSRPASDILDSGGFEKQHFQLFKLF